MLREAVSPNEIAGRLEVHANMLGRWKKEAIRTLYAVFEDSKCEEKRAYEQKSKNCTRKSAS